MQIRLKEGRDSSSDPIWVQVVLMIGIKRGKIV
jgi:hypothetical protein